MRQSLGRAAACCTRQPLRVCCIAGHTGEATPLAAAATKPVLRLHWPPSSQAPHLGVVKLGAIKAQGDGAAAFGSINALHVVRFGGVA